MESKLSTSNLNVASAVPALITSILPVIVAILPVFSTVSVTPLSNVWAAPAVQAPAPSAPPPLVINGFCTEESIPIPPTLDTLLITPSLSATVNVVLALLTAVVVVVGAVSAIAKSVNFKL